MLGNDKSMSDEMNVLAVARTESERTAQTGVPSDIKDAKGAPKKEKRTSGNTSDCYSLNMP